MSMDQKQDRVYVMPEAAKKKMQAAKKKKQPVYIFGAIYYGKTEFVKQFLQFRNYRYFSCYDREYVEHEIPALSIPDSKSSSVIVIDDLQAVCSEQTRQKICELIERNDIWLILIGRCPMPSWMIAPRTNVSMMIISEDDLRFGKKEIRELFQRYDLEPTEEELLHVERASEGNVFGILQTIYAVQNGDKIGPELTRKNTELMATYIEKMCFSDGMKKCWIF